jgi:Ca2+-binding RTX toxin-like protein
MAIIFGTDADETLVGLNEDDSIFGRGGNDAIWGNSGNDSLFGEVGDDSLSGGDGNDSLYGGFGNDSLFGDAGNDTLVGGGSIDTLIGGAGVDTFDLTFGVATSQINGINTPAGLGNSYKFAGNNDYALIADFNPNEDILRLSKFDFAPGIGVGIVNSQIQIPTTTVQYAAIASPAGLPAGTAIYAANVGAAQPELIAILQGVPAESINLTASYVSLV